ncbi:MAG: ABC transporter ATP-binding protein [Opitutales bacterium]
MSSKTNEMYRDIVDRYTDQPINLPKAVRDLVESQHGAGPGSVIQLYALIDLDAGMRLGESWLCLGPDYVAFVKLKDAGELVVRSFPRSEIQYVREIPGLSCTQLILEADPDSPPLLHVHYSHRQKQSVSGIVFLLRQALEGGTIQPETDPDEHYAESVGTPVRKAQASVSTSGSSVFIRLLSYLKPYKKQLVVGIVAAIIMTVCQLFPPYLTGRIIDDVINPFADGKLDWSEAKTLGWILIANIAIVVVLREFFLWIRLKFMAVIGDLVARDLRRDVYGHLHRLSLGYFSSKRTGSLISRVSSDTDRIWDFVAFGVVEASVSALLLVGLSSMLIILDWKLGLLMVAPLPAIFLLIYFNGKVMHSRFLRIWRKWSDMTAVLSDTIPGMRVVQAFDQSNRERSRFDKENEAVFVEAERLNKVWTIFWPVLIFLIQLMGVLVWMFALPRLIGSGPGSQPSLTVGVFVSFLVYLGLFFYPIEIFAQLSRMVNRALSSAHRIFEVLDTEPEIVDPPEPVALSPMMGNISFSQVTFGYDPVRLILKGVSFEIHQGEFIGLVGPSGAGKSTIFNLLSRFYDVTSGSVKIDGIDVRELELGNMRTQIGMVMQDPFLFHGTILENIRYGLSDASPGDVIAAAKSANAHDFICKLPNAYDTIVGERGHTLSGGERQRVSIARAVLHNPRVLLLDEATSAVDTETEQKIQDAIDRLTENRTVIAIAHRLSTLRRADRLLVMKDGRLVEQGTHDALLEMKEGVYKNLYSLQREMHKSYAI